jgi:valyl-tRNA synthetase
MTIDTKYNPSQLEPTCIKRWQTHQIGQPNSTGTAKFSMVIPPPNITGSLHMGHAFQYTIMDVLARYHRMQGKQTLWQVGTDHAGIATEMMIKKHLATQSIECTDRHDFLKHALAWQKQHQQRIHHQMQSLGISVDWQQSCFTMDPPFSAAINQVLFKLHADGLLYRGKKLVNWDPVLKTALSDLEVNNQVKQSHIWHIRYWDIHQQNYLTIATTRPETIFGDQAIAVHPSDERYQSWIGQSVVVPIINRKITVIADETVDPEFGTGCLKVTPSHDFNDENIGKKHQLEACNILNPDGTLNELTPAAYQGLSTKQARKQIIQALKDQGLLVKQENHQQTVPISERSGAVIEPYATEQWFIKTKPLAQPAIQAIEQGKMQFKPEQWTKTYLNWLHNIEDWCISRQISWGHAMPVYFDEQAHPYFGTDPKAIIAKHQLAPDTKLTPSTDVLDTWFSAGLYPFVSLGWQHQPERFSQFFPTDVLVTGFDIIFFWVARMTMLSHYCTQQDPFKTVLITGLIRDPSGQKMSKTKGNVIDPLDIIHGIDQAALIEKRTHGMSEAQKQPIIQHTKKQFPDGLPSYGTDALRLTLAALASTGRDIRFDFDRLTGYRNFCNKLWNAHRFIQTLASETCHDQPVHPITLWMDHQLNLTIEQVHHHLADYRMDLLVNTLFHFTWHIFCDRYIEWCKVLIKDHHSQSAYLNLKRHFSELLKLWHPVIPFITEHLWSGDQPLALTQFPQAQSIDQPLASEQVDRFGQWLSAIQTLRGDLQIKPKQPLKLFVQSSSMDEQWWQTYQGLLQSLAHLSSGVLVKNPPENCATIAVDQAMLYLPVYDLIDPQKELARLTKKCQKCQQEADKLRLKLNTESFISQAPPSVVADLQSREKDLKVIIDRFNHHIQEMQS